MYKTLILTLLTLIQTPVIAQTIEGKVFEQTDGSKKPMAGATVFWLGSTIGTSTGSNGSFSIEQNAKYRQLVASFVGYASDTIEIANAQPQIEFTLKPNAEIEEVQIVAREKGTSISRMTTVQQHVISGAELRKAACCNLSESFQTSASVDVSYSDAISGAKQIQLLGLAGTYTQMLTENIPNLRGLASTFGLGYVPGSWMESIQVSKGTSQVINGYEATSGQLNIEYKKPNDKEKLFLNAYLNDQGKYEINANSAFRVSKKLQSIVLGHYEDLSVKNDHNHDSFLDHPLMRQINLMNRWYYEPNPNMEMRFGFSVLDEDREGGQKEYYHNNNASGAYGTGINTRRYNAYAKSGFFFKDPETSLGVILDGTYHDQTAFFGRNRYEGTQESFYANAIFQTPLVKHAHEEEEHHHHEGEEHSDCEEEHHETLKPEHTLNAGFSFQYDNYTEMLNDSTFGTNDLIPGAFVQYTLALGSRFSFIAGLRGDYFKQEGLVLTPRFHLRAAFDEASNTVFRASAGRGVRRPHLVSENLSLLASSRQQIVTPFRGFEDGWNFGASLLQNATIWGKPLTASIDFYHTRFNRQIITDLDINPQRIYYYELDGKSYSNSFQAEVKIEPVKLLEITAAYRINDVQVTTNGKLQQKPYTSKYKGLLSASYATANLKWKFDATAQFNGPGRLPSTASNPEAYQRPDSFEAYTVMFAQVTRSFKRFDVYLGSENLTGFKQKHPVIAADDPFGNYFDASMIWGPISGRMVYAGLRYKLF